MENISTAAARAARTARLDAERARAADAGITAQLTTLTDTDRAGMLAAGDLS